MLGIQISLVIIVWMLLGVILCRLLWYNAFGKQPDRSMVVVSAILGPIAAIVHVVCWQADKHFKKKLEERK